MQSLYLKVSQSPSILRHSSTFTSTGAPAVTQDVNQSDVLQLMRSHVLCQQVVYLWVKKGKYFRKCRYIHQGGSQREPCPRLAMKVVQVGRLIFSVLNSSRGTRKQMATLTRIEEFSRNLLSLFLLSKWATKISMKNNDLSNHYLPFL